MSLKDIINGTEAILDGFGLKPPTKEVAQSRANVCLTSGPKGGKCPHNHVGAWSATIEVSRIVQAQREKKHQLNLRVEGEDGLGICKICKCAMFLKVFYDWETIFNHTSDAVFDEFKSKWPSCWMVKELESNTNSKPHE